MKMKPMSIRLSLTAAAAFGLLAGASLAPAQAQNNNTMRHHDGMASMSMDDHEGMLASPDSVSYPFAVPGGLDMFHWTDYRRNELGIGAPAERRQEVRRHNEMVEDSHPWLYEPNQRMYGNHPGYWIEEAVAEPAPANYPFAAPSSIDVYYWKDYSRRQLEFGTVAEQNDQNDKLRMMRDEDGRTGGGMRMHRRFEEDGFRPTSESMQYPFSAPATLDMLHWSDYRQQMLGPGSAMEANEKNEKYNAKRDRMLREHPDAVVNEKSDAELMNE